MIVLRGLYGPLRGVIGIGRSMQAGAGIIFDPPALAVQDDVIFAVVWFILRFAHNSANARIRRNDPSIAF
jgi:hypothetical protein